MARVSNLGGHQAGQPGSVRRRVGPHEEIRWHANPWERSIHLDSGSTQQSLSIPLASPSMVAGLSKNSEADGPGQTLGWIRTGDRKKGEEI